MCADCRPEAGIALAALAGGHASAASAAAALERERHVVVAWRGGCAEVLVVVMLAAKAAGWCKLTGARYKVVAPYTLNFE